MDRYGFSTASWTEIVWTATTALGAVICLVLLYEAYGDVRWLRDNHMNGERRLLAWNSVIGEAVYATSLSLFAIVGVWLMLTPPAIPNRAPTPLQIVLTGAFVLAAALFTAHAFLRRHWRAEYIRRRMQRSSKARP
jgi:hypothetical protein